jgi:carbonic anhydrase
MPFSTTTAPSLPSHTTIFRKSLEGSFNEGSLTTPTLAQPVKWLVLANPITLDYAHLTQFEPVAKAAGFLPNQRRVQPLDGWQVNQFDFDVNFRSQAVAGGNLTDFRKV